MTAATPEALIQRLSWRYAVKKFDATRKLPDATIKTLERALLLSPSSYGLQPWRFYFIDSPATRASLREASWNQPQITDASHMIVFARKLEVTVADVDAYVKRTVEIRKAPAEALSDYRAMMISSVTNPSTLPGGSMEAWTRSQVYIALGVLLASAAMLGVDACPMEGFDPAAYDSILGLRAAGYAATVVATLGHRAADDWLAPLPKVRAEQSDIVRHV